MKINNISAKDVIVSDNEKLAQNQIKELQDYCERLNKRIRRYNGQPNLQEITSKTNAIAYIENPKEFIDNSIAKEIPEYKKGMNIIFLARLYNIDYESVINQQSMYFGEFESLNFVDGEFTIKETAINEIKTSHIRYADTDIQAKNIKYLEGFKDELQKVCDMLGVQNDKRQHIFKDIGIGSYSLNGKLHLFTDIIAANQRLKNELLF